MIGIPTPTCEPSLSTADDTCTRFAGFTGFDFFAPDDDDPTELDGAEIVDDCPFVGDPIAACFGAGCRPRSATTATATITATATAAASGASHRE
jgi:hypothetical protein